MSMNKNVLFLELNEINFDIVERYVSDGIALPNFEWLLEQSAIRTSAEREYELLEPWIQWVSVHTGLEFGEHSVFRLGDIDKFKGDQIFEIVEGNGYNVGCLSPMNYSNKLDNPAYFIPDPWTASSTDGRWYSAFLSKALRQAVNDNSKGRISLSSAFYIVLSSVYLLNLAELAQVGKRFFWALKKKYRRSMFLDFLLARILVSLNRRHSPDLSVLFLNAGAHIQHHFMLSSSVISNARRNPDWYISAGEDPLMELLECYDDILGFLKKSGLNIIACTSLQQVPFVDPIFYYRLNDHAGFFKALGFNFSSILPRMTRDFLVVFDNNADRDSFRDNLKLLLVDDVPLFGLVEVRDRELFITMDYPHEITGSVFVFEMRLLDHISFVAIKNGEHDSNGYLFVDERLPIPDIPDGAHVKEVFGYLKSLFP